MADYELRLQTVTGAYLATIPFANLQGEMRKNEPCAFRWDTPLHAITERMNPASLIAGVTEVAIYRNGVNIFTGPIWDIDVTSKNKIMKMSAEDISSYLQVRRVILSRTFKIQTYGSISWTLINDAQSVSDGSFGITLGTQVAGTAPKGSPRYAYKSGLNLWKTIDKLASATTGFDWYIGPNRQFHAIYPRIQNTAKVKLEYGSTIKSYSIQAMGKLLMTDAFIKGGKSVVSVTQFDAAARTAYRRREYVASQTALKTVSKLNAFAVTELNLRKAPRLVPQMVMNSNLINPFDGDIDFGQLTNVIVDDGWVQFNGMMRCSGYQVTVGKHGQETFVFYMNDLREIAE